MGGIDGTNCAQDIDLLIAHSLRFKGKWWLHCRKRQDLHHMILHHVADGAGLVVVPSAVFNANCFCYSNLHMINIGTIPNRLEDAIAKAEDKDILYSLLAKIV